MWLGYDEEDLLVGRWQLIQYEDLLEYCNYYKHQDHPINNCSIKRRDNEIKRRKEAEVSNNTKGNDENRDIKA